MDFDDAGLIHGGAAVVVLHRHGGKGAKSVDLGHGGGGLLDAGHLGGHLEPQISEQLKFQGGHPVGGGEDVALQVLQLLGDVALAVHQRLLADIGLRHQLLEGVGHLDVVAEHLVVADLQGADAGFFLFACLHLGDDALAAVEDGAEPVHLRVEAVTDELTLPHGEGGLVHQRFADQRGQIVQIVQLPVQLVKPPLGEGVQLGLDQGQPLHGVSQGHQVPAPGAAVYDAADEPLHVGDAGEGQDQLLPGHGVIHQGGNGVQPTVHGSDAQKGPLQP